MSEIFGYGQNERQSWKIYLKYLDADKMRGKVGKSELTPLNGP